MNAKQLSGFGLASRWTAKFAGGYSSQKRQMTPASRWPCGVEIIPHGVELFSGMQCAIFADCILPHG